MDNALAPLNRNALRAAAEDEPQYADLAHMLRAKQMMYAGMGLSPQDIQPLMELELRRDPRIALMLMGNSGALANDRVLGVPMGRTPAAMFGRLGVESQGGARAGVSGVAVQMPDGSVKVMPGSADVGYTTPFMGGTVDVGADYGLMNTPNRMMGARLRYMKEY